MSVQMDPDSSCQPWYRFCMWAVHNDNAGDGRSGRSKNNATEEHTACECVMNDEGSWNMGNKLCNWNSKFCRYNTQQQHLTHYVKKKTQQLTAVQHAKVCSSSYSVQESQGTTAANWAIHQPITAKEHQDPIFSGLQLLPDIRKCLIQVRGVCVEPSTSN